MGYAADLLYDARLKAGLSQRELAERAGTSQSTLNRYERGKVEPAFATVERIVAACGYELRIVLAEPDRHDEELAELAFQLTPEQRLAKLQRTSRFLQDARLVP